MLRPYTEERLALLAGSRLRGSDKLKRSADNVALRLKLFGPEWEVAAQTFFAGFCVDLRCYG